jgi:AsmA-like C-terminal region
MPVTLEPTEIAPARRRHHSRSFTVRVLVSFARLIVILAISALLGGGWYLANKGFGSEWRSRIVEELHKRGVEASIRRLTLNPFRGLVAQDVRIFDYKHPEKPLARISEVSLDINYSALLHHRPFLNAVDIRNAQVSLPLQRGENHSRKAQLTRFRGHVYFPPEQIYVSQAEGILCGVHISVTGQLIKRENYQTSPPSEDREWKSRLRLLRRVVTELQKFSFPGGAPNLQVKFSGDLADLENARVEARLAGERIVRNGYEIRDLLMTAEWADQKLTVMDCEGKDQAGAFYGRGTWSRRDNAARFQLRSNIDPKPFLQAFGLGDGLKDVNFFAPPVIELSGDADFKQERPQWKIIGHLSAPSFGYRTVALSDLAVDFSWDGERTFLRGLRVRHQTGELQANLLDAPNDFRLNIHSTIDPAALKPVLPAGARQILNDWQWGRAPTVDLSIRGPDHNPATWSGNGSLAFGRARYRGVWMNSATAKIEFGDGAVTYDNLRITRNEGVGTGSFTYDFKNHEVRISNIKSSLFPAEAIVWVDPDLVKTVTPYRFRRPPAIRVDGVYQFAGGKKTRLLVNVDAPGGMNYTFLGKTLPFDSVSAKLTFTNGQLQIADLQSTLFSGKVWGHANISLARGDSRYDAAIAVKAIDFPRLTDLYYQYQTARGQLQGNYEFKGFGTDSRRMQGSGAIEVTNGNVFAIPIFGPLSEILNTFVPGSGYSIATKATATFTVRNGVIQTDDFEAAGSLFSMLGNGKIYFVDDKLDFNIRMNAHGPGVLLTPVYKLFEYVGEGSLKKPNWHPKRF